VLEKQLKFRIFDRSAFLWAVLDTEYRVPRRPKQNGRTQKLSFLWWSLASTQYRVFSRMDENYSYKHLGH